MPEPITIGLSQEAHGMLKQLKNDGPFDEMADAYRFAIALALAHGSVSQKISGRRTFLNVGSLDPDGNISKSIEAFRPDETMEESIYTTAERLAEWGVMELWERLQTGEIDFTDLFDQVNKLHTNK